jgi:hypothetical protein
VPTTTEIAEAITEAVQHIELVLAATPAHDQMEVMDRELAKLSPPWLRIAVQGPAIMAMKAQRLQVAAHNPPIEAAKSVLITGLVIGGLLGFACVIGGIIAIYRNATSPSEVMLFGGKLTTGHVGVAFVFIGMVVLGAVIRKAFKTVVQLGKN